MPGGKRVPKGKSEPSCKHTGIDLEMKIRMIHKYEGGQSLYYVRNSGTISIRNPGDYLV
jgi:hypothetical protein